MKTDHTKVMYVKNCISLSVVSFNFQIVCCASNVQNPDSYFHVAVYDGAFKENT